MTEFDEYKKMKAAGESPEAVWAAAEEEGVNQIVLFRMIREVFSLSVTEAKAVSVKARTGQSLPQHAEGLSEDIERAIAE